ncbi:MAG: DUF2244 domain-containing protein [Gammaproteobacteria bacterium]|nr:DUF2244 domain-containing protein [Gammaproteobacteria bacterium]
MAVLEIGSSEQKKAYILEPNKSLSGTQLCLAFAVIALALMAITLYFVTLGAWLVIPFTGLEVLVLGIAIHCQYRWAGKKQLIEIDDKNVTASRRSTKGTDYVTFPRGWVKIKLVDGSSSWHPRRLILGSHGRYIEIGDFLVESERAELASQLKASL